MTRPAHLGIAVLAVIAAVCVVDGARREFAEREAEWNVAERALLAEERAQWPTPLPMPTARWTPDGFIYPAREPDFDPCGSGPVQPTGTEDGDEAA